MMRAESLGISARMFAREPEQLEIRDLYQYDIIVAMDKQTKRDIHTLLDPDLSADWDNEEDSRQYRQRICTLSDFLDYASWKQIHERGGQALLPHNMSRLIVDDYPRLSAQKDIQIAPLSNVGKWNEMVLTILVGVAGLAKYVIDSYPEDLDQFWLE